MITQRVFPFAILLTLSLPASTRKSVRSPRPRAITQCSWGGNTFSLLDAPTVSPVATFNDLRITGRFSSTTEDRGAVLTFFRGDKAFFQKSIPDLSNPNGWVGHSEDLRSIAVNSSNGGAAGGWSTSIFHVNKDGSIQDLSSSIHVVEADFSARHSCKARGENYEAMQWRSNTQVLISASVYGTSDCGRDMGYTEGYILDILSGHIVQHLSEQAMLNLPYVCTYNVWQAADPQPGRSTS